MVEGSQLEPIRACISLLDHARSTPPRWDPISTGGRHPACQERGILDQFLRNVTANTIPAARSIGLERLCQPHLKSTSKHVNLLLYPSHRQIMFVVDLPAAYSSVYLRHLMLHHFLPPLDSQPPTFECSDEVICLDSVRIIQSISLRWGSGKHSTLLTALMNVASTRQ
jgi:hypothetical protein